MSAKRYNGINYDWRPESYWAAPASPLEAALRGVKGTNRRALIRDFAAADIAECVDPALLQQTLSEEERRSLGRIHPSFMGGEYLPDYRRNEVEIARIELQSTTSDVISLRARPYGKDGIAYRFIDEYESGFGFSPKRTKRPLSLGELVGLIDGAQQSPEEGYYEPGLALCYNKANAEGGADVESLRHFTTVRSDVYQELYAHYDKVHAAWVDEAGGERDDDEHGDEDEGGRGEKEAR